MRLPEPRDIISSKSVYRAFEKTARQQPQAVALKAEGGRGRFWTYAEVLDSVRRLAAGLIEGGYIDDRGVGLLAENRPEWPIAYLAVLAAGGTVVPIDANLKANEIAYIVGHSGIGAAFVSGRLEAGLEDVGEHLRVISLDGQERDQYWKKLLDSTPGEVEVPSDKVAVLIYTSGTTGAPKAVELTHRNLLANLDSISRSIVFGSSDTFMCILPLHHTFEATCGFLTPLIAGATVVYARSYKSREIIEDITYNQATVMTGVPLIFEKMYHSFKRRLSSAPASKRILFQVMYQASGLAWRLGRRSGPKLFGSLREKAGLGSVRMFVSGGAALPSHIGQFFNLIGFELFQGYGMTECSPVISVNRPGEIEFGSVGPPIRGVEVRIDSPDASGVGEVVVRGDNITPGYRDNPGETRKLLRDGWCYTGDLGHLHRGHLWITGRKKNVIVSSAGKNIYPEELEEKLLQSDYVLESVVFGRRKEGRQGEEVYALIVPDVEQLLAEHAFTPGHAGDEKLQEIIRGVVGQVNEEVAAYKRISSFDIQLEELEKTSSKKIKRFIYE